jgi:hypothetical protein
MKNAVASISPSPSSTVPVSSSSSRLLAVTRAQGTRYVNNAHNETHTVSKSLCQSPLSVKVHSLHSLYCLCPAGSPRGGWPGDGDTAGSRASLHKVDESRMHHASETPLCSAQRDTCQPAQKTLQASTPPSHHPSLRPTSSHVRPYGMHRKRSVVPGTITVRWLQMPSR